MWTINRGQATRSTPTPRTNTTTVPSAVNAGADVATGSGAAQTEQNLYKVKLTTTEKAGVTPSTRSVVFDVSPELIETRTVRYKTLEPVHMPGGIYSYGATASRNFQISNIKLISRTVDEATKNAIIVQILRSWCMPVFGKGEFTPKTSGDAGGPTDGALENLTNAATGGTSGYPKAYPLPPLDKLNFVPLPAPPGMKGALDKVTGGGALSTLGNPASFKSAAGSLIRGVGQQLQTQVGGAITNAGSKLPISGGSILSQIKNSSIASAASAAVQNVGQSVASGIRRHVSSLMPQFGNVGIELSSSLQDIVDSGVTPQFRNFGTGFAFGEGAGSDIQALNAAAEAAGDRANNLLDQAIAARESNLRNATSSTVQRETNGLASGLDQAGPTDPTGTPALTKAGYGSLGSPPAVLLLDAYSAGPGEAAPGNLFNIPVVIQSLSIPYPTDVDYIPTQDGIPFPRIMTLDIQLVETQSPADYENFDLYAFRTGQLRGF